MNIINHVLKGITTYRVTSPFGMRNLTIGGKTVSNMHNGIDLVPRAEIISAARGKVIRVIDGIKEEQTPEIIAKAQTALYYGNAVYIEHGNVVTRYAHLKSGSIPSNVKVGAIVERGQVIGYMGTTGYSTGVHLHFEVLENGKRVDPLPYLLGQKNFIDYNEVVSINREGMPTLKINTTSLIYRKTPNGERLGLLPQNAVLPYLGKSTAINGYEWAEILFEGQLVYCALNTKWNTITHQVKEIVKTIEVIKEVPVVKPINKTVVEDGYTLQVIVK